MDNTQTATLLYAIGGLIIIALLLALVRHLRLRRYQQIAVSKQAKKAATAAGGMFGEPLEDDALLDSSEASFGRSRVVGVRDEADIDRLGEQLKQQTIERTTLSAFRDPSQTALPLDGQAAPSPSTQSAQAQVASADDDAQMIIVHLLANRGATVAGGALRDALIAAGLRYGEMKIFHYYQADSDSGEERRLFSLANAVKPGNFELRDIEQLQTPGVTLFLNLSEVAEPQQAFDTLLQVVDQLAAALDLHVYDESRSSMTRQTIDHCRQRARAVASQRQRDRA